MMYDIGLLSCFEMYHCTFTYLNPVTELYSIYKLISTIRFIQGKQQILVLYLQALFNS